MNLGSVKSAQASGDVDGSDDVGGLVEQNSVDTATVSNAEASGDVTGSGNDVGGLVGDNSGSVTDSSASGAVTGSSSRVGGLVGVNSASVTTSFTSGEVTGPGSGNVGGIIGLNTADGTVSKYYTISAVDGAPRAGGIAGANAGAIEQTYAAGLMTGSGAEVGGLVGDNTGTGIVSGSYWDNSSSGTTQSTAFGENTGARNNVTGLPTSQMQGITPTQQGQNTMAGFGFARDGGSTWFAVVGGEEINPTPTEDGYPILQALDIADQLEAQPDGADDQFGVGDFQITKITDQTPSEVSPNDSFAVQYTVENVGENTARQAVRLELNGQKVATKPDTLTPGQAVTNSFTEVSLPDNVSPGDTVTLTVRTNDDAETVELNVTESGDTPAVADYANEQNVVTISGVSDAISDWQSGEINIGLMSDVITAWQSGTPVG